MAAKPESSFIASVHKHLVAPVYAEKMYNPLRGGTPDVYYEGGRHLWVEYKFITLPKRDSTMIVPELSELQQLWLGRAHAGTGRAKVIVGCKVGKMNYGVIYHSPDEWEMGLTTKAFKCLLVRNDELARYIERQVL